MSLNVRSGEGQLPTFVNVLARSTLLLGVISTNVVTAVNTPVSVGNVPGVALAKLNAIAQNNFVVEVLNVPGRALAALIADPNFNTHVNATRPALALGGAGFVHSVSATNTPASGNFNADWNLLKAGAVMSSRFDTSAEVTTYVLGDGSAGNVSWDSTVSWFGHALKFNIPTTDSQNSGNWARHLDDAFGAGACAGIPSDQGYDPPMVFEIAYAVYITAEMRNTVFPNGGGWKTSHFSHDKSSNCSIEVVWQNTNQRGYVQGYHRNPPDTTPWDFSFTPSPACSFASPDFKHQPAIDHGASALVNLSAVNPSTGAAWSNCEKVWAQYGGNYSYGQSGYQDAAGSSRIWKYWEMLDPGGQNIGPFLYPANDWIVLKVRVDLNSYAPFQPLPATGSNRIRWYAAKRGATAYTLLADQQNCWLPQNNDGTLAYNQRFNTAWLDVFHSARTSGGGVSTAAWYGWIVSRRDGGSIPVPQLWPEAGNTTIEQKFANMAMGVFSTLDTPSMTPSLINSGSDDNIMSWARRGHWDPSSPARAYFYGCAHGGNPVFNYGYVIRYEAENHAWVKEALDSPEPHADSGIHGYYHHALRQSDGRQWVRRRGNSGVNTIYSRSRGGAWETTTTPGIPGDFTLDWNVGDALEWYPDFNGGVGALVFASQAGCWTWQPGASSWVRRGGVFTALPENDDWICYNRADKRIYFGGGGSFTTTMRRLDSAGNVTTVANAPFSCGSTTFTASPVISSGFPSNKMFAVNPSGHAIHEYDHIANSWSNTGLTLPFTPNQESYFHVTVPNVGVFFHYIQNNPSPSSTMHLWRR